MTQPVAELASRLAKLSASLVSDVLDHCGYPEQSLSSAIAPLSPAMRLAGPAVCFEGVSEPVPTPARRRRSPPSRSTGA